MASASEIAEVRENTDERTQENWSDPQISDLIDASGVNTASAIIWRRKAAAYAKLVDVSEAGSSHAFSDLQGKAIKMAETFEASAAVSEDVGRAKVKVIDRAYRE